MAMRHNATRFSEYEERCRCGKDVEVEAVVRGECEKREVGVRGREGGGG